MIPETGATYLCRTRHTGEMVLRKITSVEGSGHSARIEWVEVTPSGQQRGNPRQCWPETWRRHKAKRIEQSLVEALRAELAAAEKERAS